MAFQENEARACQRLIDSALEEDLGGQGDITSRLVLPSNLDGRAGFVARSAGVVAGLPAAAMVFQTRHTPRIQFQALVEDGARVALGDRLAAISGLMAAILVGERTALNFLAHLSGIATLTRKYVDAVAGLPVQILDTRKTLPGWRLLEKYAVRQGGGSNHRLGLYDGILIKDNHLAVVGRGKEGLSQLLLTLPPPEIRKVTLEIEVDTLEQLAWALTCLPDMVLLDNMPLETLRQAVALRNSQAPKTRLEASGGVTLATVRTIAETGVDRISIGALTHSAPALDIALDYTDAI